MDRELYKDQFWGEVTEFLEREEKYDYPPEQVRGGVANYRGEIEENAGEAVYNAGVRRAAEAVDGLLHGGPPPLLSWSDDPEELLAKFRDPKSGRRRTRDWLE